MIQKVKPFVNLSEDGTLTLKSVPEKVYEKLNLYSLEKHFDQINEGVKAGKLVIDKN